MILSSTNSFALLQNGLNDINNYDTLTIDILKYSCMFTNV